MRKLLALLTLFVLAIASCASAEPEPVAEPAPTITATPEPEPEPEPDFYTPSPEDFTLEVVELEKRCFGSAGCNITYRVEIAAAEFEAEIDPDITYELLFEIEGGDDPASGRMTIRGESFNTPDSQRIGTPSSDSLLIATPTRISETTANSAPEVEYDILGNQWDPRGFELAMSMMWNTYGDGDGDCTLAEQEGLESELRVWEALWMMIVADEEAFNLDDHPFIPEVAADYITEQCGLGE